MGQDQGEEKGGKKSRESGAGEKTAIEVHGQRILMVTRKCRGCDEKFRVSAQSKQKFHSSRCERWPAEVGQHMGWLTELNRFDFV